MNPDPRVTVVVLTHNRAPELERTLRRLQALPEQPRVIAVDNGSRDDTAGRVRQRFPQVHLLRCEHNLGAAGRNVGVDAVRTPFVAFCDDDTWWAPGALGRAADLLQAHPRLAAVAARVLVGRERHEDATCAQMAHSPIEEADLPGRGLIGFMAGAVVMRTEAYRDVGGYEPRLFIGAEERLMGLDLAARGWRMAYVPELVVHHQPSVLRDEAGRRMLVLRNELWIAWMRLPWRAALRESARTLRGLACLGRMPSTLWWALKGLPWALARRRVVPPAVEAMRRQVLEVESRHDVPAVAARS
ncbi:MAG: glycosyltransferase [Pseudomonadota bacterium]